MLGKNSPPYKKIESGKTPLLEKGVARKKRDGVFDISKKTGSAQKNLKNKKGKLKKW